MRSEAARMDRSLDPKVFVVDDDVTICRALERLFRSAGHAVEVYTSPEEFLERAHVPEESIVILDVRMPAISGPEVMARLAARGATSKIFFVTADDDAIVRSSVLAAGACGWFTKPLDGEALLAAVGSIGRGRANS
jgi:FixJ family two-component response regulator